MGLGGASRTEAGTACRVSWSSWATEVTGQSFRLSAESTSRFHFPHPCTPDWHGLDGRGTS